MAHERRIGGPRDTRGAGADADLVAALEQAAETLGIEIRRETLDIGDARLPGGLCTVGDRTTCILSSKLEPHEEASAIGRALLRFDLDAVFLPPAVREFLGDLERQ